MNVTLENYKELAWTKSPDALIPAIIQDSSTKRVLMLGYFSVASMEKTLTDEEGLVTFWSRSRQELWTKGKTSGNVLQLRNMRYDCDSDALLILAEPVGPTCHVPGQYSCFGDDEPPSVSDLAIFIKLEETIRQRQKKLPEGSYTTKLFKAGMSRIAKKVGEEATEVVVAALSEGRERLIAESADLLYHISVLWRAADIEVSHVAAELEKRHMPNIPQLQEAAVTTPARSPL
jgi:phosphoribosyl-ATP pyrophosphohydrolase/phosphoribosyl-AMP cyclohydrolase